VVLPSCKPASLTKQVRGLPEVTEIEEISQLQTGQISGCFAKLSWSNPDLTTPGEGLFLSIMPKKPIINFLSSSKGYSR
jgi:hypothetical protein